MKLRDHYDWLVLGDDPGALLTASMASRLGLSVLVVPMAPGRRRTLSEQGQVLDFEANFLIGLRSLVRSNGLLLECLRRSGMLGSEEGHLIRKEDAFAQILTPEARLSFPLADDDMRFEVEREFGKTFSDKIGLVRALAEAEPEFLKYWFHLPDRLTLSDNKVKKEPEQNLPRALDGMRAKLAGESDLPSEIRKAWFTDRFKARQYAKDQGNQDFADVLRGIWFSATGNLSGDPALSDAFHLMVMGRGGASFRGGLSAYRDFLVSLARNSGAHVVEAAECRRIFLQNGQFAGIQISSHANMITAGGGVLGCPLRIAAERITESGKKLFRRLKSSPKPTGWKFTFSLLVNSEAIARGVSSRMLWCETDAPPLEIEVADPQDYGIRSPGTRLIFLRTVLPFETHTLESSFLGLMATRMFKQLTAIIPFVEFHVIRIFPDFRPESALGTLLQVQTRIPPAEKDSFSAIYGFKSLEEIPFNLCCFEGRGTGSRSGVEGLFVASGEAFPELGSLGATVAALESIAWIAHRSGLAGPFVVPSAPKN